MSKQHIYFVGINGASLNGIAQILVARGYRVSGSDVCENEITQKLRGLGINVFSRQLASNITKDIDEVVISSAALNGPGAVEIARAKELGIKVHKRTAWWKKLMGQAQQAVAVAGSHGKTSTTAMIGHVLSEAGLNPTVMVGGYVPDFSGTVRVGAKELIVVEADEYDKAFHQCAPTISVITNIDFDHPDTYPTLKDYIKGFRKFAKLSKKRNGSIIANGKDKNIRLALSKIQSPIKYYSEDNLVPNVRVPVVGEHMLLNAQAAFHVCHRLGVAKSVIVKALKEFRGVGRRFEFLMEYKGMNIYDDFAHHPTEVTAVIKGAKEKFGGKVGVIFQPHQRIRTKQFLADFSTALEQADAAAVLPIYEVVGREEEIDIKSDDIADIGDNIQAITQSGIKQFVDSLHNYSVLLVMGAGDINQQVKKCLE